MQGTELGDKKRKRPFILSDLLSIRFGTVGVVRGRQTEGQLIETGVLQSEVMYL